LILNVTDFFMLYYNNILQQHAGLQHRVQLEMKGICNTQESPDLLRCVTLLAQS